MLEKLSDTRVFLEENVAYILMAAGVAFGLAGIFTVSLMERPTFSLVTIYFAYP